MSFSRARIRRFNDETGNTPAPGSYDPKFDSKIIGTGAVIEKCERFAAPKSNGGQIPPPAALNTSFNAGRKSSSLSNLPVFRTPKVPQKATKAASVKGKVKLTNLESRMEEKHCQDLESLLVQKELKIRDLEVDLELLKEEYEKNEVKQCDMILELEGKLDSFQAIVAERDMKIESQQALLLNNISEIEQLKADLSEKKNLTDKLRQLTSSNKALKAQHSEVSKVKDALDEKMDDLVKEIFKLHGVKKELRGKLLDAEATISEGSLCIKNMEDKLEFLQVENFAEKVLLEDKIEDLYSQRDELEKNLADKEETITLLKKAVQVAHEDKEKLSNDMQVVLSDLKDKDRTAAESKEEFEKKIAQKQEMILLLQGELSEKELEQEDLSSEHAKILEQAEWGRTSLNESEARVVELSHKINDLSNNLKMMEENVTNASILKENMESTISCQQAAFTALQVDYDALRIDLEGRMVNQIMESSRKFSELSFELLETRGKLQYVENDCSCLNQTRLDLEARLVAAMQEMETLALVRDELRVTNLEYQLTIADLHDKADSLAVEINANSTYCAEQVEKSRAEVKILRKQCKIFEIGSANLLETLQAVSDRLVESSRDSEAQAVLITKLKEANSAFEQELTEQAEVLEAQKLSMIVMEAESIREIEEIRASLLNKLEQMRECYDKENKKLMQEFGEEFVVLQAQISDMALNIDIVEYRYFELEQLHSTLQHNFKLSGAELEETKFDLLCLQDVLKEREDKIRVMESDIAIIFQNCEQSTLNHKAQIEAMQKSLTDSESKVLAIQNTNILLGEEISSKNCETAELKKQFEMQLFALENEVAKYKVENCSLKKELTSLTKSLEDANKACTVITSEIGEVRARNETLSVELAVTTAKCFKATKEIEDLNSLISTERVEHEHDKSSFLATIKQKEDCLISHAEREEQWSLLSAENIAKEALVQELRSALQCTSERLDAQLAEKNSKDKQLTELKEALQQSKEEVKLWESGDWKQKYMEMASLVGPFRQQLEEFEAERHGLESRKEAADNQVKALSLKYAQVLGHQNHKQKIHHVVQLKEHNLELKQTIEKLEGDIRSRDKSLKKLKSELASVARKQTHHGNQPRRPMTPLALSKGTENTNPNHSPGQQSPNLKSLPLVNTKG